ncbi:MAG: carbonic anhydrase [Eubacterium sp.]
MTAEEALEKLKEGNQRFMETDCPAGDLTRKARNLALHGQHPYAVIVSCSDSRVIPEAVFSAGIGELFVIRVAGSVIDAHQLGSIEYAVDCLGAALVVVLGHTRCGAVDAAIRRKQDGFIGSLVASILPAIGEETDNYRAGCRNACYGAEQIRRALQTEAKHPDLQVSGAMYHLDTGCVDFL